MLRFALSLSLPPPLGEPEERGQQGLSSWKTWTGDRKPPPGAGGLGVTGPGHSCLKLEPHWRRLKLLSTLASIIQFLNNHPHPLPVLVTYTCCLHQVMMGQTEAELQRQQAGDQGQQQLPSQADLGSRCSLANPPLERAGRVLGFLSGKFSVDFLH